MKTALIKLKAVIYKKRQPLTTSILLILVVMSYQNCQQSEFYEKDELASLNDNNTVPDVGGPVEETGPVVVAPPSNETICDKANPQELICNPLGDGPADPTTPIDPIKNASELGLIANLYEGQNGWASLDRYFIEGYKHPTAIYFSNFNVTPRSFSQGFNFSENDFLKNKAGNRLIEWFAIEAKGQLALPESATEGYYHITTISDDGIEVKIDDKAIISHKGTHAPVIDCANALVKLTKDDAAEFQLRYFQGPRYQIALMTFIKKVEDPTTFNKKEACGTKGNAESLKKLGYTVIAPQWFKLPANN